MKKVLILLALCGWAHAASAQNRVHQDMHKSIHDDGSTLRIDIHGTVGTKEVAYHNAFNVKGWRQADKDAMIKRITDSLGVSDTPPPPAPPVPLKSNTNSSSKTSRSASHINMDDDGNSMRLEISGINSNGKSVSYSRTPIAKDMSRAQKDALIKHITDSLGISNDNK